MNQGVAAYPNSFAAKVVDADRPGSVWGQVLVGGVGVVLALTLVLGQVSLATTKGIERNLDRNVAQLRTGNTTMKSIIERAAPSMKIDTLVKGQSTTLAHTNQTMTQLNREMATVGATTDELAGTVGQMETTSGQLAAHVGAMERNSGKISALLGRLPGVTDDTHKRLQRIGTDTGAINGELEAIAAKMQRYGLPPAKKVQKQR